MRGFHEKAQGQIDKYQQRWRDASTDFKRKSTREQINFVADQLEDKFDVGTAIRRQTLRNRINIAQSQNIANASSRARQLPPPGGVKEKYNLRGIKNRIRRVASKMKEYQSEFDRLAGSGANQDIKFSPNVDLKIEADRLMEFHDGLIAFLEARGYRLGGKDKILRIQFVPSAFAADSIEIGKIEIAQGISDAGDAQDKDFVIVASTKDEGAPSLNPLKSAPFYSR